MLKNDKFRIFLNFNRSHELARCIKIFNNELKVYLFTLIKYFYLQILSLSFL